MYVRREGSTNEASYEELQRLIEQRIAASPQTTQARSLKEHLEELKVLYGEIPRQITRGSLAPLLSISETVGRLLGGTTAPNPDFPSEDYDRFVRRILEAKKALIERLIGISQ